METRELTFEQEKETKNTVRYQEQPEDGNDPVIGPLYVQKSALGEDPPKVLSVTVSIPTADEPLEDIEAQFDADFPEDEEPADEELESVEVGFTDAELGL
jgi:hypothetical protein